MGWFALLRRCDDPSVRSRRKRRCLVVALGGGRGGVHRFCVTLRLRRRVLVGSHAETVQFRVECKHVVKVSDCRRRYHCHRNQTLQKCKGDPDETVRTRTQCVPFLAATLCLLLGDCGVLGLPEGATAHKLFWQALREFTPQERSMLITFTWGR